MDMSKAARINREKKRLTKLYNEIDERKQKTVDGLIQRAAFMRISLDGMEADIHENGFVEKFSQSPDQEPYDRKRPIADLYNTMNASYQKIIKQLTDLLPREEAKKQPEADPFAEFVNDRDE